MRHRYKSTLKLNTWCQTRNNVVKNLLTSLIKSWQIITTTQKARVLKAEVDKFFSRLLRMFEMYKDEKDVRREAIRYVKSVIFTENEWKKIIDSLLPKYKQEWRKSWFVSDYKMWTRLWDWAEKILVKLN